MTARAGPLALVVVALLASCGVRGSPRPPAAPGTPSAPAASSAPEAPDGGAP